MVKLGPALVRVLPQEKRPLPTWLVQLRADRDSAGLRAARRHVSGDVRIFEVK